MRITKTKKLDKRFKKTETINRWFNKYTRAALVAGLITGSLLGFGLFYPKNTSPEPQGLKINVNPVEVKAIEKPYCKDAISCIRDIGEKQGRSNKTIMTMIRIAQKESNMNPKAKNKTSSARGLFQILAGTWYSDANNCTGDKYNYQDNITCAYKILDNQGLGAWQVCTNGSAKCY